MESVGRLGLLLLLFLMLGIILGGSVLVLLVLGHKVVHVRLSLSELHLVHAFTGVPVEEGLAAEHGGELLRDTLEELLDGSRVTDEGTGHLEAARWNVADGGLDVVRDPLNEVRRVLVLDVEHLLVNLLHGHAATEDSADGEVPAMAGVAGGHHVLGSNICWVSSGTVRARYCCEPREVSGAKPIMKKWRRGNGIMLTASLRRSQLSWPGKRRQQVVADMTAATRWLRSPKVGVVSLRVRKQMS